MGQTNTPDEGNKIPAEQPAPTPNDSIPIWELVVADMMRRNRLGALRYGTPLQANNGRDALVDAYEEALDLAVYLRQELVQRGAQRTVRKEADLVMLRHALDRTNRHDGGGDPIPASVLWPAVRVRAACLYPDHTQRLHPDGCASHDLRVTQRELFGDE